MISEDDDRMTGFSAVIGKTHELGHQFMVLVLNSDECSSIRRRSAKVVGPSTQCGSRYPNRPAERYFGSSTRWTSCCTNHNNQDGKANHDQVGECEFLHAEP